MSNAKLCVCICLANMDRMSVTVPEDSEEAAGVMEAPPTDTDVLALPGM